MIEDLYVKPGEKPEFVGIKLPFDVQEWENTVMEQLGNTIDPSKYDIMVDYKKIDRKKGNAVGTVSLKVGKKSAYIPLIIHDFYLQPLDIFFIDDKGYPLKKDLLGEMMADKVLMFDTKDIKKVFPSHKSIEGESLLEKFSCTTDEQKALLSKVSEEYKEKVKSIKLISEEEEKLAFLAIDKLAFNKYQVKYAFEDDPITTIRTKEMNYQSTNGILDKVGQSLENVTLPYRIRYEWPETGPKQKEPIKKLEVRLDNLYKSGITFTRDGDVDSGRILPLANENANIVGKIFIGRKSYGTAKEFVGKPLTSENNTNPIEMHPRKGDKFVFVFSLNESDHTAIPVSQGAPKRQTGESVAMGPFEYNHTSKTSDAEGNEEVRIHATKNLKPIEFVMGGNFFTPDFIEKKNNVYYVPKGKMLRLNGSDTNYIQSQKEMNSKIAAWNPHNKLEFTSLQDNKYLLKCGETREIVDKQDRNLMLSRVSKDWDEPIYKMIIGRKTKQKEAEEKAEEEEKKKKDYVEDEEKEAMISTIQKNNFLKEAIAINDSIDKEAEEVHFDDGVDAALALNLLTSDRIQKFVNALPEFRKVLNIACDLLIASRLGKNEIDQDLIKSLIDKLYSTIEILETLQ